MAGDPPDDLDLGEEEEGDGGQGVRLIPVLGASPKFDVQATLIDHNRVLNIMLRRRTKDVKRIIALEQIEHDRLQAEVIRQKAQTFWGKIALIIAGGIGTVIGWAIAIYRGH